MTAAIVFRERIGAVAAAGRGRTRAARSPIAQDRDKRPYVRPLIHLVTGLPNPPLSNF